MDGFSIMPHLLDFGSSPALSVTLGLLKQPSVTMFSAQSFLSTHFTVHSLCWKWSEIKTLATTISHSVSTTNFHFGKLNKFMAVIDFKRHDFCSFRQRKNSPHRIFTLFKIFVFVQQGYLLLFFLELYHFK